MDKTYAPMFEVTHLRWSRVFAWVCSALPLCFETSLRVLRAHRTANQLDFMLPAPNGNRLRGLRSSADEVLSKRVVLDFLTGTHWREVMQCIHFCRIASRFTCHGGAQRPCCGK